MQSTLPPILNHLLKEKTKILGSAFVIRADSPFQRYLMPASPKPASVKLKTSNWGFCKGVIPVDPQLGKIEKKHNHWILQKRNEEKSVTMPIICHKISLQEIWVGLHNQEFSLVNTEKEIAATNRLLLISTQIKPHDCQTIFSINLNESEDRIQPQQQIDFKKFQLHSDIAIKQPAWWQTKWGNFLIRATSYYPAQYQSNNKEDFQDILIYGIADKTGNVLPITGDQDLLWITVPSDKHKAFLRNFDKVINTFEEAGSEELYTARIALHIALGGNPEEAEASISHEAIAGLGCVTPYESYVIDEINTAFTDTGVKHLRNLIQHAPENHNPGKPSPLDTKMIHVWRGNTTITHSEQELIRFVMQSHYTQENIYQVHPQWNMANWAPVIANQQLQGQLIIPTTLKAYQEFCKTHQTKIYISHRYIADKEKK